MHLMCIFVYCKTWFKVFFFQGYPVALLWYIFFILALQVHAFELYFARVLVGAWLPKRKTQ
jgi:hypothetical protein